MDDRKFEIRCEAGPDGHLHVKSRSLSVGLSQLVNRDRIEELWQSVLVICEENPDGSVWTKIIVCHPDWDQNYKSLPSGHASQMAINPLLFWK